MQIRNACVADADAISALILSHLPLLTVAPDGSGAERFLQSVSPAVTEKRLSADNFRFWVAEIDKTLVGVLAVRDTTHLFHMFVAREHARQGLATRLWMHVRDTARADGEAGPVTVNSSLFALPVYRRFGFVDSGPRVEADGVAFVPMRREPA